MIDQYKVILQQLIKDFKKIKFNDVYGVMGEWVDRSSVSICQTWFSRCSNLIENITSTNSYYCREAERIIKNSKRRGGIYRNEVEMLKGHLEALYSDIEDGLLAKLEYKISAQDFLNFFDHAKSYLKQQKKVEASVISSSIFEDTIRKIGKKNGIEYTKLDRIIDELTKAEIITGTEAKKLKYFAGIRNDALHADWDKITLNDVKDLVAGTENVIENYLEG